MSAYKEEQKKNTQTAIDVPKIQYSLASHPCWEH